MNNTIKLLAISILGMGGQQAQAFTIELDYSYDTNNFFDTQAKKDALGVAASYFENRINDSLTAITSSGTNHFNAGFFHPATGVYGSYESDFSVAADILRVFAGGRDIAGTTIGAGGPGGFGASGSQSFLDSISRGQTGVGTSDFAPWGGAIAFDTAATWYFDTDVSTVESFSGNDFYSVAVHEFAHLLGFGTADSWTNQVTGSFFTGAESGTVELSSDLSHWNEGTMSLVDALVSQEAAMDPDIVVGSRKYFTGSAPFFGR